MTEDKKAKALVNKFYFALPNNGSFEGINSTHRRWEEAKQCALITIDEMISVLPFTDLNTQIGKYCEKERAFLNEVKQEIELL